MLRVIGDVHAQVDRENLVARGARPYAEIIADAEWSIQIGDMGDGESYDYLRAHVDAGRHRFFPGNHDHYDQLPPHCLGDSGAVSWGAVDFFFIRGAASIDRERLKQLGHKLGRTLWFEQEELTDEQMAAAEEAYLVSRPKIVLSHDAPAEMARFAWQNAALYRAPDPAASFAPSRTNDFLTRLWNQHPPELWIFGHHHHDWQYRDGPTRFECVGELSYVDIDAQANLSGP
jgi:hypothetical protein